MPKVCSKCNAAVAPQNAFCDECGGSPTEVIESPEAIAQYEEILGEFAADGVLDQDELDALAHARAELEISLATHDALVAKDPRLGQALRVTVEVDEATLVGFLAGTQGMMRVRVRNAGSKILRSALLRYAVSGEDHVREESLRMLKPTAPVVVGAMVLLPRHGQYMLELVVRVEDLLGKVQQFYRSEPIGFRVGQDSASGPQSLVVNQFVQADAMRVAGDKLAEVNVGAATGGTRGGALSDEQWRAISLRPISPSEWEHWALRRDAGARQAAADEARRTQEAAEAKQRAEAEARERAKAEATERARREAEARARAEAETRERARAEAAARAKAQTEAAERTRAEAADRERAAAAAAAKAREAASLGARLASVAPGAAIVRVPAGTFRMGTPSGGYDDERPVHAVTITRPFELWSTPVTQAQWKALMGNSPSKFSGDARPVECVSWYDAVAYCNALSRALGLDEAYVLTSVKGKPGAEGFEASVAWKGLGCAGFRLPTEAEWEYACRAGTTGERYGELDAVAWYDKNSGGETHPVAKKQPNAWGLYDTIGNVWEWVWDWKGEYSPGDQRDPTGPDAGAGRVYRGGGWSVVADVARAAYRRGGGPGTRGGRLGFRPSRSLP